MSVLLRWLQSPTDGLILAVFGVGSLSALVGVADLAARHYIG